ncbi:MAG: DUF433 domain-containing protein [Halobacteria archaeon]
MREPHIKGRRISVRQIHSLVEERDIQPETVVDRYDLDVANVYHALAYYHDNPREMNEVEKKRAEATIKVRKKHRTPRPREPRYNIRNIDSFNPSLDNNSCQIYIYEDSP